MDRKTWNEMANELVPILKQLRQVCRNYRLSDMLNLAVDDSGDTWAYTFEDFRGPNEREYRVWVRRDNTVEMSDNQITLIRS